MMGLQNRRKLKRDICGKSHCWLVTDMKSMLHPTRCFFENYRPQKFGFSRNVSGWLVRVSRDKGMIKWFQLFVVDKKIRIAYPSKMWS